LGTNGKDWESLGKKVESRNAFYDKQLANFSPKFDAILTFFLFSTLPILPKLPGLPFRHARGLRSAGFHGIPVSFCFSR